MSRQPPRSTLFPYPPLFRSLFDGRSMERRRGVWPLRLAIGIVRIRREAESKTRLISFTAPGVELHQPRGTAEQQHQNTDRKSTRLNSSHSQISYAVFCLKNK